MSRWALDAYGVQDTHSRTRASKNRSTTPRTRVTGDGKGPYPRRSSGLRVQFVDVEVFSLLPQCQRNRCNLACSVSRAMVGLMPLASERW